MTPYYEGGGQTLYLGDMLDLLEAGIVAPDSIDNILGDPPYSSGGRQAAGARQTFEKSKRPDWFLGDNMGADSYRWWMREFGKYAFPLLTLGGHCYLFTDWRQYPTLLEAIETRGLTARAVINWDKNRGGALGSFWRSNHEWIVVFTKGPARGVARHDGFNTWTGSKPQGGEHPTEKPLGLIEYILGIAGGRSVFDPWVGSGKTLIAAKRLGMVGVGCDLNERFLELTAAALERTLPLEVALSPGVLPLAFDDDTPAVT